MNARTRLLLPALAAALLAGCATTDDRGMLSPGYDAQMVNDAQYIAVVENLAKRRGVRVHWINPPKVPADE